MDGEIEEKKEEFIDINQNIESTQLKNEKEQKPIKKGNFFQCLIKPFQKIGDEIWFALTFIGRIIMTLYSFHGLFFTYNFIIQFIILIPGRLYDLDSIALQWIFGLFYIFFSMAASNVLVIPTYEFFLFPYLNFKNPLAHLHSLIRVKYVINDEKEKCEYYKDERKIENKNIPIINFLLILISIFYTIGLLISLITETKIKDYAKVVILFIIYTYYSLLLIGYTFIYFYIVIKLICFSCKESKNCWLAFKNFYDLNAYFGDPEKKNLKINNDDVEKNKLNKDINNEQDPNMSKKERNLYPLPRLNLLSYVIHPVLMKAYKFEQRDANIFLCSFTCDIRFAKRRQ